jgi:glutaredoxin
MDTHVVTLYSRPGCHLCDVAKANILASRLRDSFRIEEINVDADEALKQRYGNDVPVVLIDGISVFKHAVETGAFDRKLRRFNRR